MENKNKLKNRIVNNCIIVSKSIDNNKKMAILEYIRITK